jgi:hypothetical protein
MCDCYCHKCEGCGCDISIHIADFCTPRENIHPYCPRCTKKLKKQGIPKSAQMFTDTVTTSGKYSEVEGGKKGQEVIILCDDPDAYGVSLN